MKDLAEELKSSVPEATLGYDPLNKVSNITIDDLYRLRASVDVSELKVGKAMGAKESVYYLYKKGQKLKPLAITKDETLANFLSYICEITDIAITSTMSCNKLDKENRRLKGNILGDF